MRYSKRKRQEKQEELTSDIVAVGDRVTFALNEDGTSTITSVEPRRSVLSRARPSARDRKQYEDREQVLIANPDQVIFVFSLKDPAPSLRKLDRFLVVAEINALPAIIVANKVDLGTIDEAQALFGLYEKIGYDVLYVSAQTGFNVDQLRDRLAGKLSVLTGSSGVGKSSLLNVVQPGLGLKVGEVSEATTKGKHTTRHTELVPLEAGGYVADTPGIRGLAIFNVEPGELDAYFREIAPLVADCEFSDCRHIHEKRCGVRQGIKDGLVSAERYESYLRLREEHELLDRSLY